MPTGGVQRQLTLPPAPDSARHARRFVSEVLTDAREDDLLDVATLLTSELVTNGIVHAHTELRVVVDVTERFVRVEVADGNPNLPARREYDESAMTGRGMEMVELLAHEFGAEPLEGDGKRVWFRLVRGDATGAAPGEPDLIDLDAPPVEREPADAPGRTLPITLRSVPVALYCAWQQHADAMLREATLVALDENGVAVGDYPLAAQALGALAAAAHEIFVLRDRDVAAADVSMEIATEALPWFPILRDLLARAAALSVTGRLLTPPSLPEIVALRNWVCEEVSRQAAGLPAQPWEALDVEETGPAAASAVTLDTVRHSELALVAADASNRIVAVSDPAKTLLGWEEGGLEGRRLVTIIPARMRDRHVAGFTRHLLDGTTTLLGRTVTVPALRRDGTEIEVELTIERRPDATTRALFVATLKAV
ncbi:MAG TPA: PAS domain S-box protein [Mycobacteriales bacterium]|nr:PAS domain S-box protein [Mycobacteriales bacterium]